MPRRSFVSPEDRYLRNEVSSVLSQRGVRASRRTMKLRGSGLWRPKFRTVGWNSFKNWNVGWSDIPFSKLCVFVRISDEAAFRKTDSWLHHTDSIWHCMHCSRLVPGRKIERIFFGERISILGAIYKLRHKNYIFLPPPPVSHVVAFLGTPVVT